MTLALRGAQRQSSRPQPAADLVPAVRRPTRWRRRSPPTARCRRTSRSRSAPSTRCCSPSASPRWSSSSRSTRGARIACPIDSRPSCRTRIVIALFAIVATLFMQEKVLATTAVGAVVIGFALQDTLGNLFSGLAIQIEKPFRVGHWVTIAGTDGLVSEVTWRATKIRTKAGNFVVVPNSVRRQGDDHQLLGADPRHAARSRGRRQLRHAAERGEGGDRARAARRAADRSRAASRRS